MREIDEDVATKKAGAWLWILGTIAVLALLWAAFSAMTGSRRSRAFDEGTMLPAAYAVAAFASSVK
jgi:hypothetical protein